MNRIQTLIQRAIRTYSTTGNTSRQKQIARRLNFLMTMAVKMRHTKTHGDSE